MLIYLLSKESILQLSYPSSTDSTLLLEPDVAASTLAFSNNSQEYSHQQQLVAQQYQIGISKWHIYELWDKNFVFFLRIYSYCILGIFALKESAKERLYGVSLKNNGY